MDFSSSSFASSSSFPALAFTLDGQLPLPLLVSNDSPNSTETCSSADFNWTGQDFYSVMEMNRLLDDMQRAANSECLATSPISPISPMSPASPTSTGSSAFYCCQWIGCTCPVYTCMDSLVAHVMQEHVTSGKSSYVCGWAECSRGGRPFAKRHKIMTHIRSHTGERPYACEMCGKRFARHDSLVTHTKLHVKKRAYHCAHAGCKQSFGQVQMLEHHERTCHTVPAAPLVPPASFFPDDPSTFLLQQQQQEQQTALFSPELLMSKDVDWSLLLTMNDCLDVLNYY